MSLPTSNRLPDDDSDAPIRFSRVLRPNRSVTHRDLQIITAFIIFLFLPTGLGFLFAGAWPVFGIMGLEVIGLIFALHYNHRLGSAFEAITITDQEFRLSRVDHWGKRKLITFQPQWMRVRVDETSRQLIAGTHGKHVVIGKFLTEDERKALAEVLQEEVRRLAVPDHLAPSEA